MSNEKIDLFKLHKSEYKAGGKPAIIETSRAMYLTVDGKGAPASESFQTAITALYGMAYTMKMGRKSEGKGDYTIGKLEGIYWMEDGSDLGANTMEDWSWNLLIRTPELVGKYPVSAEDLETARTRLQNRKKDEGTDKVHLSFLSEGPCVQMLHIGSYEKEHETLSVMHKFCKEENYRPNGHHHEIYISDPRRVAPEKLKTILRMPVEL